MFTSDELASIKSAVEFLCREVGAIIVSKRKQAFRVDEKAFNNLVTEVDKYAETLLVDGLKSIVPQAGFLAEEGTGEPASSGLNWIIDPIDGTTNFVHDIPLYCISIALAQDEQILVGVVYEPNREECFSAFIGGGSVLNGKAVSVSEATELAQSLLATGFPYDDFGREAGYFEVLRDFTHQTRGIRRLGSAALDLAYVAVGRFEAFYEYGLNPWDVAAGMLLVEEAGGKVSDFRGGKQVLFGEEIIASNGHIHPAIEKVIQHTFKA